MSIRVIMKTLLIFLTLPLFSLAQYQPNEKLPYKAKVVSDSLVIKGYYVTSSDSAITVSTNKRYLVNETITIPANRIRKIEVKNKPGTTILSVFAASVIGFTLTAGLTKNFGDTNNDGETSFWELIYTAIEGSTSKNRRRRNTALIVGAAGGTTAMVVGLLANKKLVLVFPINNRQEFFNQKKYHLTNYTIF